MDSSLLLYFHRHPCGVTGVCRKAKLFPGRVGARPPTHGALESRGGVQSAGDLHPAPGAVPARSHLVRARRPTWNLSDTDTHGCTGSEIRPLGRLQNQQQLHTGGSANARITTHTHTWRGWREQIIRFLSFTPTESSFVIPYRLMCEWRYQACASPCVQTCSDPDAKRCPFLPP